jgi:hypothetical protein
MDLLVAAVSLAATGCGPENGSESEGGLPESWRNTPPEEIRTALLDDTMETIEWIIKRWGNDFLVRAHCEVVASQISRLRSDRNTAPYPVAIAAHLVVADDMPTTLRIEFFDWGREAPTYVFAARTDDGSAMWITYTQGLSSKRQVALEADCLWVRPCTWDDILKDASIGADGLLRATYKAPDEAGRQANGFRPDDLALPLDTDFAFAIVDGAGRLSNFVPVVRATWSAEEGFRETE